MKYAVIFLVFAMLIATSINCSSNKTNGTKKSSADMQEKDSIEVGAPFVAYEIPYANDHSVIYNPSQKKWHMYGILSSERAFIHLTADSLTQKGWKREEDYVDEGHQIWAPHIIKDGNLYHMFYTKIGIPREIHRVKSKDLYSWSKTTGPVLALKNELTDNMKNKDPMVLWDNDQWIMYYSMMKDKTHWVVGYSTSNDLINWSEPKICFDENTEEPSVESPFVVKRGEYYYLLLSARPWPKGGEEFFRSKAPFSWKSEDRVRRVDPWHAAEVVKDIDGKWYLTLSSAHAPHKDFQIAPMFWNDGIDN